MEITILGVVLGLLLLALPVYIIYSYNLPLLRRLLLSLGWAVVVTAVLGLVIHLLMSAQSVWMNIIVAILLGVVAAVMVVKRARLSVHRMLLPVAVGMVVPLVVIGLYVLFLVLNVKNPFDARFLIPLLGLMAGCATGLNARALHAYYMGLEHHNQLYYYLLGNGSTHQEAVRWFARRAFMAAMVPVMKRMGGLCIVTAPVMMLAMVLAGATVLAAVVCQLLLFVVVMAYTLSSLFITLWMARRYAFDEYDRLVKEKTSL